MPALVLNTRGWFSYHYSSNRQYGNLLPTIYVAFGIEGKLESTLEGVRVGSRA